ncbi:DUF1801 domain-containing protein [Streptomyces werraensis]|uniref:DUF1801 domain-containing protein n=1 Tax=Streptomyces werraensis TaxID=68284 RepID=UPI00381E9502
MCRAEIQGCTEVMAYGMPAYERDGVAEIACASRKQDISFYPLRGDALDAFAERPADQDAGGSCLRFSRPDGVDLDLVRDLLRATVAASGPVA